MFKIQDTEMGTERSLEGTSLSEAAPMELIFKYRINPCP